METKIQIKRDTTANWTSINPILSSGEFGLDIDLNILKIGDGLIAWNNLGGIGNGILFYDFVNKFIGIGINNPSAPLHIVSNNATDAVVYLQNLVHDGFTALKILNSEGFFDFGFTVVSKYSQSGNAYSDMGYCGIFGSASVIPLAITANNDLAWYLAKAEQSGSAGKTGFYNNRPRGLFDICYQRYSMGLIYMTDFPQPGDTITITDANLLEKTFEFQTSGGSVTPGNIKVVIPMDIPSLHENLVNAIKSSGLMMDADDPNADNIALKQQIPGVLGDISITKIEAGNVIQVAGMLGGWDKEGEVDFFLDSDTGNIKTEKGLEMNGTKLNVKNLPTSPSGLEIGDVWIDIINGNVLKVVL